jgi:hypothetical protein
MAVSVLKMGEFSSTLDSVTQAQTTLISSIRAATVSGPIAQDLITSFKTKIEDTSKTLTEAVNKLATPGVKTETPPTPLTVSGAAKIEVDVKGLDLKFADAIKPAIVDAVLEEMKKKGYSK